MNKKIVSLILCVVMLLGLNIPYTLANSIDGDQTSSTFQVDEGAVPCAECGQSGEHAEDCPARCTCGENRPEVGHVATCDLYTCEFCGVYLNRTGFVHSATCGTNCSCGDQKPEDGTHLDSCKLHKCDYCGRLINQEDHEIYCIYLCTCGNPEPTNDTHLDTCLLYKCPTEGCHVYQNQGVEHFTYCEFFVCRVCEKAVWQTALTDDCNCYYGVLASSVATTDDTQVYVAFLDKSRENIVLFDAFAVAGFPSNFQYFRAVPTASCPDYVFVSAQHFDEGGQLKYCDVDTFDADLGAHMEYGFCMEPKYFSGSMVADAAGLYATVGGSGTVSLYKDPANPGDVTTVDAAALAGEYVVADMVYSIAIPEETFYKLSGETWPGGEYVWVSALYITNLSRTPALKDDFSDRYGAFVSEEDYNGWATITPDAVDVYSAVNSGNIDTHSLTGANGVLVEVIKKAIYENGVLYQFAYSGDDAEIQNLFAPVNNHYIPEEHLAFICTCNCGNCIGMPDCGCCDNCACTEEADTSPVFGIRTIVVNGVTITVEGLMPSEATLSGSAYTVSNPAAFGLADASNVKAAFDIKLLDAGGNAIQPDGNVFVSMDAAAMGLSNGDVVEMIHQHGSTVEKSTHVVISGKLVFPAPGFSVFIVNSTTDKTGTEITGNSAANPYVMTVGKSKIFYDSYGGGGTFYTAVTNTVQQMYNNQNNTKYYYGVDGEYEEVRIVLSGNRYTISYADGSGTIHPNLGKDERPTGYYTSTTTSTSYRGEWQVTDESMAIAYEITSVNYQDYKHMAPYIEVTAKDVGLVTLTYKYVSGSSIRQEILYIRVVRPEDELYVDDQVAEKGCLVPVGLEDEEGVTYTWSRSDGQLIQSEALNEDGTVNVSLDHGGLTEGRDPITYTVTATLADGREYTASYEVLYSNEILNPSFENTPVANGMTNQYFYNGYPGLYWKTTTPGSTTGQLTQDIEIITEKGNPTGSYGSNVTQASHGEQFAEVNAEGFGALYQDILTTPDATLNWSFAHMARTHPSNSENTMYVVVAATEYAQSVINFNDINSLLDAARGRSIPSSGTGASFTYNGGTYYIWKHTGIRNWETISGSYAVPDRQFLTRLFFVSETANAASVNETCGNLIDAVSAGETMSYRIEYYVDGSLVNEDTQTGNATINTTVHLQYLEDYIDDGYVMTAAKLGLASGAVDYPGNVENGLFITSYGASGDPDAAVVLRVYFAKRAVTITKNIVIEGWASMSNDEKAALIGNGLTAKFALTSDSETYNYNAELTIIAASATGALTAVGEFVDSNDNAPVNGTYTVSETIAPIINGYSCSTAFDPDSITISDTSPTNAIVCTNTYNRNRVNLTVGKTVVPEHEGDPLPNPEDSFTFTFAVNTAETYTYSIGSTTGTIANGGTFTLTAGQTISIFGLPQGAQYSVLETANDDYITTVDGMSGNEVSGTLGAGGASHKFVNTYKRQSTDLTITKFYNSKDLNQTAQFFVSASSGYRTTVIITGEGSATIRGLKVGDTVTITENKGWVWRYSVQNTHGTDFEANVVLNKDSSKNVVTFTNTRGITKWLSGENFAVNKGGSGIAVTYGEGGPVEPTTPPAVG